MVIVFLAILWILHKKQRHQEFGISNFDSTKCRKGLFLEFGLVFDSHFNGSLLLINDEPETDTHTCMRER